jgi:glucokinase
MKLIGIDLGGTNIAVGLVTEEGKIIEKVSVPTGASRHADEIVKDMAECCFEVCRRAGVDISEIDFCGIASPGICNNEKGLVECTNNITSINTYPMVAKLRELTGIKNMAIENDANAAAKGEAEVGAAKDYKTSVMVTLGTGVGGGVVIDHKIYKGFNFAGGELGHTVIVKDGEPCTCGRRGCFEAYASVTALIRMTKEMMAKHPESKMWELCDRDLNRVNGKTSFDAMRAGDEWGKKVVDEYISYLACGITNIINIFEPEVLSIGGGASNERDTLLKPLV